MNWYVKKHKKVYSGLNFIEHFLILASNITGCIQFLLLLLWLAFQYELRVRQ